MMNKPTHKTILLAGCRGRRAGAAGWTLTELLAVIAIMALAATLVLPTVSTLFYSSAEEQARSMLSAMLGAARAAAIENHAYSAVHVQIGKNDRDCWAAPLLGEDVGGGAIVFRPMAAMGPQKLPGGVVFGGIDSKFVNPSGNYVNVAGAATDFTTFTVAFGPDGSIVTQVGGGSINVFNDAALFGGDARAIWPTHPANEIGVRAVTFFPYAVFKAATNKNTYLDQNGQFICLNPYTGQLMRAE